MNSNQPKLLKIETYTVPTLEKKTRLQDLAPGMFAHTPSKSGLKKAIKNKLVTINGSLAQSGTFLNGGEIIDLFQIQEHNNKPKIDIQLEVIFEDDYLALVNKPPGITVSGIKKWTLENALVSNLKKSTQPDALNRPEPIHRLDHPTSGILLIGKTSNAVILLNKLFENKEIQKIYYAVTIGKMKPQGLIEHLIDSKLSLTHFEVIKSEISEKFDYLNLVKLKPQTGRKHQLRKHLSEIGNPILGDKTYGTTEKILKGNGLYLHAFSLDFIHPITKEKIGYSANLTKKFTRLFPEYIF